MDKGGGEGETEQERTERGDEQTDTVYNTYKCIIYGGNAEPKFSWSVGSVVTENMSSVTEGWIE